MEICPESSLSRSSSFHMRKPVSEDTADAIYLKKFFHALRITAKKLAKADKKHFVNRNANRLQRQMRRLYAIRLARLKARVLRREYKARILIQRIFRGYAARRRFKRKLRNLYVYYRKIDFIAHRYWVLWYARDLKRKQLTIQSFARMTPDRIRFKILRNGIITLQRYYRVRLEKYRALYDDSAERERLRVLAVKQNKAARVLQRNWKATFFNKSMSPFILMCCIYHRTEEDEHRWHSTNIQRRWRGYIVRLRIFRVFDRIRIERESSTLIQKTFRMYRQYKRFPTRLWGFKKIFYAWKRFLYAGRPRLRLGFYVCVLQRTARWFNFIMERHYAARTIQCLYRMYHSRRIWAQLVLELRIKYVNTLKRAFRVYMCRKKRKEMIARRHMAAYKLNNLFDSIFVLPRKRREKMFESQKIRTETNMSKKEKVYDRRMNILKKVNKDIFLKNVAKVQRVTREFLERKREEKLKQQLEDDLSIDSSVLTVAPPKDPKFGRMLHRMLDPIKTAQKAFGDIKLISREEEPKLVNSILKYQVRSILQEGIIQMRLTIGEIEFKSMEMSQNSLRHAQLPHFIQLKNDISGTLDLQLFLWVMYGTGLECICQTIVQEKPTNMSIAGLKMRASHMLDEGVKVIWHPHIHFEILGVCSVKQGKGDFAVQDIKIASNPEEAMSISRLGKEYSLVCDFSRLGFHDVSMWSTSRKLGEEDNLYKIGRLTAYDWFDERLSRIIKSFNLSESDVLRMRESFDDLLYGRNRDRCRAHELFIAIGFPYNHLARWAYEMVHPEFPHELTFSEYVQLVSTYVMFSGKDLMKFLFTNVDSDGKQYLRRDQFNDLLEILADESPFNVKVWQFQYENYYDKNLGFMFIKHLGQFFHQNPGALWLPQLLQRKLMKHSGLGVPYWEKKMEQFRIMRKELGIKLI